MKQIWKSLIRTVLFFLCAGLMVVSVSGALRVHGLTDSGYFKQPVNSLDTVYIGSCHFYSTIMPSRVDAIAGTNSYLAGGVNMTARVMYYYLKATLERQHPKTVFLDSFAFTIHDSYVDPEVLGTCERRNIADLPLLDRIKLIVEEIRLNRDMNAIYYAMDISSFHENWIYFSNFGADNLSEDHGWKEYGTSQMERPGDLLQCGIVAENTSNLREDDLVYLEKILDLAEREGTEVIFISVPYEITEPEAEQMNSFRSILEERNVEWLDFTQNEWLSKTDFRRGYMNDANHTNRKGAEVISDWLGRFLMNRNGTQKSE